jgi:hypothetical protein
MVNHRHRFIFNKITTLGHKQVVTGKNIGVCDVIAKIRLQYRDIEEGARQKCAFIYEFRCFTSLSMRDLEKTHTATLELKCVTDAPAVYCPYRLT